MDASGDADSCLPAVPPAGATLPLPVAACEESPADAVSLRRSHRLKQPSEAAERSRGWEEGEGEVGGSGDPCVVVRGGRTASPLIREEWASGMKAAVAEAGCLMSHR